MAGPSAVWALLASSFSSSWLPLHPLSRRSFHRLHQVVAARVDLLPLQPWLHRDSRRRPLAALSSFSSCASFSSWQPLELRRRPRRRPPRRRPLEYRLFHPHVYLRGPARRPPCLH
uniref:Putative secreted protein n=1 Tax=Ixodes ricinus TaxID=34613 RepID=A0A6B0ULB7_IXORI